MNNNAVDLVNMSPADRRVYLENEISKIDDFPNTEPDFQIGVKFEYLLKTGLPIQQFLQSKSINMDTVKHEFEKFLESFPGYISDKLVKPKESIYTLTNLPKLSMANTLTRNLGNKLGALLEDIATLSPKVLSTEKVFNRFKIRGVDFIIVDNKNYTFCQMKTMKPTLTGSQAPRAKRELMAFENSSFIAALDFGNWTFKSDKTQRISGREFWDLIDMSYDDILENLIATLKSIEQQYGHIIQSGRPW